MVEQGAEGLDIELQFPLSELEMIQTFELSKPDLVTHFPRKVSPTPTLKGLTSGYQVIMCQRLWEASHSNHDMDGAGKHYIE